MADLDGDFIALESSDDGEESDSSSSSSSSSSEAKGEQSSTRKSSLKRKVSSDSAGFGDDFIPFELSDDGDDAGDGVRGDVKEIKRRKFKKNGTVSELYAEHNCLRRSPWAKGKYARKDNNTLLS